MSKPTLPLTGIRIIEFSHMVMGPSCGMILADLGADVIKIEPAPNGDNTRKLSQAGSGFFPMFNRNKRSIGLNMKTPEGLEIAKRLIRDADAVVENFRPGAMDKLGLGYEELKKENPKLIYASAKGFLPGPYEERVALDEVVQMMAGLAYMTGPVGRPLRAGSSVVDIMGGAFAAISILAALIERKATGEGQAIVSALFEACVLLMGQHMAQCVSTGEPVPPMTVRRAAWGIYDIFDCADGEQLFVGVVTDTQWNAFCKEFEITDLAEDETLATNPQRSAARDRTVPRVQEVLGQLDSETLIERVARIGLPYAPIGKPEQLFDDPHLQASDGLVPITLLNGKTANLPALPVSMGGRRFGVYRDMPQFDEHSDEVLGELGLNAEEIADLRAKGVLAPEVEGTSEAG